MKIKNISTERIILAGVKIQSEQTLSMEAFGEGFTFAEYEDEITSLVNDHIIVFVDESTGKYITDMSIIKANMDLLIVNDNDVSCLSTQQKPDFYYNYKVINLEYGEDLQVEFVGYLKTLNVVARAGDIEIQIVQPLMNKVLVQETNNYEIDADYKLLNPIIKIKAKSNSKVELYMDGIFKHDTKTKNQYLKEIYSNSKFPEADVYKGLLKFKVNFKRTMTSDVFRDIIGNNIGRTYHNTTLRNFNKFEDGAYVKFGDVCTLKTDEDFTINFWFKSFDSVMDKQYLVCKSGVFEIYFEKGVLKTVIDGYKSDIVKIEQNKYYMFTISYSAIDKVTHFYLNDEIVKNQVRRYTFYNNRSLYFGSKNGSYCLRSAELGEFNYYSYHMSAGMVRNLFVNNNPDHQFKDLNTNCQKLTYNCDTDLNLDDTYSASIIAKEFAKSENLVEGVKSTLNNTDDNNLLTIHKGYVYFPEDGKYTFEATLNKLIFTIDDKDVLINEETNTFFIEEGYYTFEATSFGAFHITYGKKGTDQIEIPVFNDDLTAPIVSIDNQTGGVFTGVVDGKYYNLDYTRIENISDAFFGDVFTITLDVKLHEKEAEIFASGDVYDPYIALLAQDNKIILMFRGLYLQTKKISHDYNRVDITADGNKIYLYLNGHLECSANFYEFKSDASDLWFGRSGDGKSKDWLCGDFDLKNVKFYKDYSTPFNIQGRL